MIDTRHIEPEDLALHALRLLSPEESAVAATHLEICAACRAEYQTAMDDLAVVALSVELETPRPQARQRFLNQVAREKRVVSIDRGAPPAKQAADPAPVPEKEPAAKTTGGTVLPWLGWAVAAGVTFFAVGQYREHSQMRVTIAAQSAQLQAETAQLATLSAEAVKARDLMETLTASAAMRVTLNTTPGTRPAPQGRASYLPSKGTLVFIANNLEPLPLDKVYELWIIPADGTAPVPAGTFHPDALGNASVVLPKIPTGVAAKAFGVTLEAEGGSAKPTPPILMVGQ